MMPPGKNSKKRSRRAGLTTTTEYISGIQYTNGAIDFVQTEEGRARLSGSAYKYEYDLKDHLGNTRATVTWDGADATQLTPKIVQQNDYYAFGLSIKSLEPTTPSPKNQYLYNGKELQEETGQYDYGARFYDPSIGRWTTPDPLAEKMRRHSPYNYGFNNPMRFVDPDGMAPDGCCGFPSWKDVKEIYSAAKKETNKILEGAAQMLFDGPFVTANKIHKAGGINGVLGRAGAGIGSNVAKYVAGSNSDRNEVIGTALPNVALLAIPESRIATVGDVGASTEIVQRAMSTGELEATQSTGLLRGGRDGTHYASDAIGNNANKVRQRLALPNTPEVKVTMEVPGGIFSPPSAVWPKFQMPGGGLERTANGNVPVVIKNVKKLN